MARRLPSRDRFGRFMKRRRKAGRVSRPKRVRTASPRPRKGRTSRRRVQRPANPAASRSPKMGVWAKLGRMVDVLTTPIQHGVSAFGTTKQGLMVGADRLTLGAFNLDGGTSGFVDWKYRPTIGSIGTGLVRNWVRSKIGVYRGVGQKKILSIAMAVNPEILASALTSPIKDPKVWNKLRVAHDRGYDTFVHQWTLNPNDRDGERFWRSVGLDGGLFIAQKLAQKFLNPHLPKGINL